jgi:hypothetical protein
MAKPSIDANAFYRDGSLGMSGSGADVSFPMPTDMTGSINDFLAQAAAAKAKREAEAANLAKQQAKALSGGGGGGGYDGPTAAQITARSAQQTARGPWGSIQGRDKPKLIEYYQSGKYGMQPRLTPEGMASPEALSIWNSMVQGARGTVSPSEGAVTAREMENIRRENEYRDAGKLPYNRMR